MMMSPNQALLATSRAIRLETHTRKAKTTRVGSQGLLNHQVARRPRPREGPGGQDHEGEGPKASWAAGVPGGQDHEEGQAARTTQGHAPSALRASGG